MIALPTPSAICSYAFVVSWWERLTRSVWTWTFELPCRYRQFDVISLSKCVLNCSFILIYSDSILFNIFTNVIYLIKYSKFIFWIRLFIDICNKIWRLTNTRKAIGEHSSVSLNGNTNWSVTAKYASFMATYFVRLLFL